MDELNEDELLELAQLIVKTERKNEEIYENSSRRNDSKRKKHLSKRVSKRI